MEDWVVTGIILNVFLSYGFAQLSCPAAELKQTTYLTCSHPGVYPVAVTPPSGNQLLCSSSDNCITLDTRINVTATNDTILAFDLREVRTTDAGKWTCGPLKAEITDCVLLVYQLQTCNISQSGEGQTDSPDTVTVTVESELTLQVDIEHRECGNYSLYVGRSFISLQSPDIEQDIVRYSPVFNVTKSHIGKVLVLYECDDVSRNLTCNGITSLIDHEADNLPDTSNHCGPSTVAIVCGTITAIAVTATISILVWFYLKRRRRRESDDTNYSDVADSIAPSGSRFTVQSDIGPYSEIADINPRFQKEEVQGGKGGNTVAGEVVVADSDNQNAVYSKVQKRNTAAMSVI